MQGLIDQQQLMDWSGFKRPCDLEKWLIEKGIKYHRSRRGKIVTTITAVDSSLIQENEDIVFADE